jgi:hypothetical protein
LERRDDVAAFRLEDLPERPGLGFHSHHLVEILFGQPVVE